MQSSPQPRQRRSQRNRAQYPEDTQGQAYPSYPEYEQPQRAAYPQENTWQQAPYQPPRQNYQQNNYYQQQSYPQQSYPSNSYYQQPYPPQPRGNNYESSQPPRRSRSGEGKWLLVIILCIAILAGAGFYVSTLHSTYYPVFQQKLAAMSNDRFYAGVHVDGVHLGGMTMAEARLAVQQYADYSDESYSLAVTVDGKTWRITQNELPLKRNTEAVLMEAFTIGRQGTLSTLGSDITPFEARYQHAQQVNQQGAYLYTEITYDKATVRRLAETIASRVYVEPRDASVHSFDSSARTFKFNPEQVGAYIDAEQIYSRWTRAIITAPLRSIPRL